MGKFGDELRVILQVTGLKYAVVAQEVNFDASYISKWINTNMLPSSKAAESVCKKLAALFADSISDAMLEPLGQKLHLNLSDDPNKLESQLFTRLVESYRIDAHAKEITMGSKGSSGQQTISLTKRGQQDRAKILQSLALYRKRSNEITITVLGDLIQCPLQDLLFLMDIQYEIDRLNFERVTIEVHISKNSIRPDRNERSNVALINWISMKSKGRCRFYYNEFVGAGLVICIHDLVLYNSQLLHNNRWLITNTTWDRELIAEYENALTTRILPVGKRLFERLSSCKLTPQDEARGFFPGFYSKVLTGTFDIFLLSEKTLERLFALDLGFDEKILAFWKKKYHFFRARLESGEDVKYVFYRDAFERLTSQGVIRVIDKEVTLPIELRMKVLEDLNDMIGCYNFEFKVANNYLVNDIRHTDLPNMYLAARTDYFISFPRFTQQEFIIVRDERFHTMLHNLFDLIWVGGATQLLDGKEVIGKYITSCHEMLAFELFNS